MRKFRHKIRYYYVLYFLSKLRHFSSFHLIKINWFHKSKQTNLNIQVDISIWNWPHQLEHRYQSYIWAPYRDLPWSRNNPLWSLRYEKKDLKNRFLCFFQRNYFLPGLQIHLGMSWIKIQVASFMHSHETTWIFTSIKVNSSQGPVNNQINWS